MLVAAARPHLMVLYLMVPCLMEPTDFAYASQLRAPPSPIESVLS